MYREWLWGNLKRKIELEESMARRSIRHKVRHAWQKVRQLFRREDHGPEDPYAYVTAPRKPRPPYRSAAVAEEEP